MIARQNALAKKVGTTVCPTQKRRPSLIAVLLLVGTAMLPPIAIAANNPLNVAIAQETPSAPVTQKKKLKIGVLAHLGKEKALKQWKPTAEYLSKAVPGYTFEAVPLDWQENYEAVKNGTVDFAIVNPGMYLDFEKLYNTNRIATLKTLRLGKSYTVFGGVIFRRKDRQDIQTLQDLRGKTVMAVEENSLGGWQFQWGELQKVGIDPYKELKKLEFAGEHEKVVEAVRDGKADVGTVRTDTLEQMAQDGKIKLDDFVVINPNKEVAQQFPFLISTPLYPEWPFAATKNTPGDLAEQVAIALMQIPPDSPAAKAAKAEGWTVPLNYRPVDDLFLDLQIGPYAKLREFSWEKFLQKYWYWFALGGLSLAALAAIIYQQRRTALALKQVAQKEQQQKETLEKEIAQLIDELQGAADGDLSVRASLSSMEMSTVADLFNAIIDSLRDIAVQVKESSTQVSSSLGDNEQSIQVLAAQAVKETEETRQTLGSVEQMAESIEQVAANADRAATLADDTYQETQAGSDAMDETVNSILSLRTTVGETAKKIKRLGESSQKISQVVSLIEEIALKTNLLAINASVEASRAGEQGQGFTVVAEQVGALAEQSAAATKEIAKIVAAIQAETQEVTQAMESGTSQVVDTTRLVEATKQRLAQVLERSRSINQLMQSISKSTVSQADTSRVVTDLMQQIARQSESRLSYSQQIAQSIQETAGVAKQLESAADQFKVS